MRGTALVLACSFLKGSAIPEAHYQSLNGLETFLLAQDSLHAPRQIRREMPGTTREALRLRGGGLVDVDTMAKVMTALATLSALQVTAAPKSALDTYGIKKSTKKKDKKKNDVLDFVLESNGIISLGNVALSWAMINGADSMKAIGYGYVPSVLSGLKNIKDKRASKVGMPEWTQKFFTALNGFFAYSFLTGQSYCPTLSKIASGWTLLNGIFGALRPKKFSKNWGLDVDGNTEGLMKHFGYQLVAFGLLSGCVGQGTEFNKALGYAWAAYLAAQVDNTFISKSLTDLKKEPVYVWMLLEAAATATLLGE